MPGGRKRSFEENAVLHSAMEVFWRQGYESTSVTDLTRALGINPPSLYAAFGSKRGLFERALRRYMSDRIAEVERAMSLPSVHAAVGELLTGRAVLFTEPGLPAGCMTVQAGLTSGDAHHEIADLLTSARDDTRRIILSRLEGAVLSGELPANTDCAGLARFIMTTIDGLSIEAASGAPRAELVAAAVLAAQVIPRA